MFGKNPVAPIENATAGTELHLVKGSPFVTIQGEGPYAGHPAIFIRLHGCNLRCTFCDTQFSDEDDPVWSLDKLVDVVRQLKPKLVVVTGGEPMRQNIFPLCALLTLDHGKRVQIETAGTLWIAGINHFAEIVVSPKTPVIHPMIHRYARAFKYVVDIDQTFTDGVPVTATQPNTPPRQLARPREGAPVYYSPMDVYDETRNQANRKMVANLALTHGGIAGLQMHKFFGVD